MSGKNNIHLLVCNFFLNQLDEYQQRLLQSDMNSFNSFNSDIHMLSSQGRDLLTNIAKIWSSLTSETTINPIALTELEDNLFSKFILLSNINPDNEKTFNIASSRQLKNAEEYINENLKKAITRDELSETAHCSIRTLSRQFLKKYGIGPMAYVKQCRLNAAYLELLGSNTENTSVND